MAHSWFRMYAEFATDPKVQMMSESDQRRLTMLFCIRCNGVVTLQDTEVTFLLRINDAEWSATKELFVAKGFINNDNEILNWDKRQYVSDSSAARVSKHRDKMKRYSNVTVTPPDTEQIQNRIEKPLSEKQPSDDFNQFWKAYPKKTGKGAALKAWKKAKPPIDKVLQALAWQRTSKQWTDGFIPLPATYINQTRWEDEPDTKLGGGAAQVIYQSQPVQRDVSKIAEKMKMLKAVL